MITSYALRYFVVHRDWAFVGGSPRTRRGFTIIEVLVTIGVIGVLIAIVVLALGSAKAHAGQVMSLSHARGVAMSMQAYAETFGQWPFAKAGESTPGASSTFPSELMVVPTWPPGSIAGTSDHWSLARLWPGLVARVAPWEENIDTWMSPGLRPVSLYTSPGHPFVSFNISYIYSNSFVGSPRLWSESSGADESLIAATTPSMVEFPSNKVLVWDGDLAYLPRAPAVVDGFFNHVTPMAFVDQHAEALLPQRATPGVANPLNHGSDRRLHNTPAGVLGRDY